MEVEGISNRIRRLGHGLSLYKQVIKDAIEDRIGHFFGMKLHTDNATIWRFDTLYDSIFTAGTYIEFSANRLESLEVKAIGRTFGLTQNGREMGIGIERNCMGNGIFGSPGLMRIDIALYLNIGIDCAAKLSIDKLHAIADAQNGHLFFLRVFKSANIIFIARGRNRGQVFGQLANQTLRNTGTASNNQAIEQGKQRCERFLFLCHRQNERTTTRAFYRNHILVIERLLFTL